MAAAIAIGPPGSAPRGRLGPRLAETDLGKCNISFEICVAVHASPPASECGCAAADGYSNGLLAAITIQVSPLKLFALEQEVYRKSAPQAQDGRGWSKSRGWLLITLSESCFCCCPVSAHLMAATCALGSHPAPENHHAAPARMLDDARCCDSH